MHAQASTVGFTGNCQLQQDSERSEQVGPTDSLKRPRKRKLIRFIIISYHRSQQPSWGMLHHMEHAHGQNPRDTERDLEKYYRACMTT
jgi:hypothetical protein